MATTHDHPKNINVRFIRRNGEDIPGAGFFYARQPYGDAHAEMACALAAATQKATAAGRRISEVIRHPDELKIWVA